MSLQIDTKYIRLISSRLRNFKQKNTYLWNFSCPICGDSQKNKLKARGYAFQKGNNMFYRCHNCGTSTNIGNLLKHVDATLHKEYILERYKAGENGNSNFKDPEFNIKPPKFDKVEKQKSFANAEWISELPEGHYCLEYVKARKIPKKYYDKLLFTSNFKIFADSLIPNHGKELVEDARLVVPFYDEYDQIIAVSGRALENSSYKLRYVTLRTNDDDNKLIYGMDRVNLKETVKLVEGPIDSLFLKNCVASGDSSLEISAKMLDTKKIILIWDNEPRNKEIVKMMQNAIKSNHNVVIWPNNIPYKDINEMIVNGISQDEIENIISSNTFSGLEAQTKFVFWKKV
jgi:transcription elongation factor Elf1